MSWERARKPEQKAIRRNTILDAARSLYTAHDYDQISLNGIAREAGISKPNIYRYFATREEIFLTIFSDEHQKFVESMVARFRRVRSEDTVSKIVHIWVEEASKNTVLMDLLPQLATSMERHSSVEQLLEFKTSSYALVETLVAALTELHPRLTQEQWAQVVQCVISMMAGLWPLTNPGENVIAARNQVDSIVPPWEFGDLLTAGMTAIIQGME